MLVVRVFDTVIAPGHHLPNNGDYKREVVRAWLEQVCI